MEIQTRAACTDALLTWQVREIGGKKVTVFQQESEDTRIASIILRASTTNVLDDLARAVDDGTPVTHISALSERSLKVLGSYRQADVVAGV